jgi:plastocyanin
MKSIYSALFLASLAACSVSLLAQQAEVKAHVELLRNGHKLKNASNAVIWLTPIGSVAPNPPAQAVIPRLEQKNKAFHPALVVVPVGGKVEFPNDDPFFHNVFSLYEGKRFDLHLYETGAAPIVKFDRPGVSYIFCNIHPQMSAVVMALSTPYYGISSANGEITIPNVPPGRYQMRVFHASAASADLKAYSREIQVEEGSDSLGEVRLHQDDLMASHKNKYGLDYDPPSPDSPEYARP